MTFSLGSTSLARLSGVHPDLIMVVQTAITLTTQDFTVQEGLRSAATQKEYLARGVTKTLDSKHLLQPDGFGHAVDLVPWIAEQPRWEWPPIYNIAAAMRAAAEQHNVAIRWGGVWDRHIADLPDTPDGLADAVKAYSLRHPGPDFLDGPHMELA